MSFDLYKYANAVTELSDGGIPFVTITLVAIRGSAPQVVGAKAIVTDEGIVAGTVGGGKIEARAIEHARAMLAPETTEQSACEFITWNLQTDIGMTCGGEVQLLFEHHDVQSWNIAVFGAGHLAQALIPVLLTLNCRVFCIDSRDEWLSRLPSDRKLRTICSTSPEDEVRKLPTGSFLLSMTQGHTTDVPVLSEALRIGSLPFVGVIGSQQKAKIIRRELIEQGIHKDDVAKVHCPLGLAIGNNTPAEIAISIAAQLLQVRDEAIHSENK